ncbi:MAG: flagellar motor switch protein FliM [Verrucomicrobiota bacterium]
MADPNTSSAEVLSQNEVEALLAGLGGGGDIGSGEMTVLSRRKRKEGENNVVQGYDFRSPVFLSPERLRRLRIKHEEMIRSIAARLSTYLRLEFAIQMSRLETIAYKNILENLPVPSHLTLFKLNPLEGMCLFDLAPRLGLTVLDRMMGGPGHGVKNEREFTDIEVEVLQNFIRMVIKEYADAWLKYQKLDMEIIGHENTARFLKLANPNEVMLFLEMEARFGDVVAGMRFVFPFYTIEALIDSLMAEVHANLRDESNQFKLPEDENSPLYQFPIPVSAHWEGFTMTLRDLNHLAVGDVLFLDNLKCKEAIVNLGPQSKFIGTVHTNADQQVTVKITSKIKPDTLQSVINIPGKE